MRKLLTITFIIFSSYVNAQLLSIVTSETLNQRIQTGVSFITPDQAYESTGVLEPSVVRVGDSFFHYYTGGVTPTAICLATSYGANGTLNKRGVVVGNGTVVARNANSSCVVKSGSTFYMYAASGYGGTSVYLYTSTNGYTWVDQGVIFNNTTLPSLGAYGNQDILVDTSGAPIQVNGKYRAYIEANQGFQWMLFLAESTSLTSGWTYVQKLSTLQVGTGSWSGASTILLDGVTHIFYHYSSAGTIPTYLAYATSNDGRNFFKREVPFKAFEALPYGVGTDQNADVWVEPAGNDVYFYSEYGKNSGGFFFTIYRWHYSGTFKQLITGLSPCTGCSGVYP